MALIAWDDDQVNANSYVRRAQAQVYFDDALHAASWEAAADTVKDQSLVTATRQLDRQNWRGEKVSATQPLEWPRNNIVDRDGNEVANDDIPIQIREATYELALALLNDANVQTQVNTFSNIKRVRAGSAEVEFSTTRRDVTKFPTIIQELIGQFLEGAGTGLVGLASGTDEESQISDGEFDLFEGYP